MKTTTYIPRVASCSHLVSGAGVLPFAHVAELVGISSFLDSAVPRPGLTHTLGDVWVNLALSLIAGGDDVHDITLLSSVSTALASKSLPSVTTAWRRITEYADTSEYVREGFIHAAKQARTRVWDLLGDHAPHRVATVEQPLVIDIDATLITAHSEKENATPTYKKGFGFHPLCAFIDYTSIGLPGGEFLSCLLRPGNAGANTTSDHCQLVDEILATLPDHSDGQPWGKRLVIRADSAGGTKKFISILNDHNLGYVLGYSASPTARITLDHHLQSQQAANADTQHLGTSAHTGKDCDRWDTRVPIVRASGDLVCDENHFLEDITGLLRTANIDEHQPLVNLLADYPEDMRVIARIEPPHPGCQHSLFNQHGVRAQLCVTNLIGTIQHIDYCYRNRSLCEQHIKDAKDQGLAKLPLKQFGANQIWCLIVALSHQLLTWTKLIDACHHKDHSHQDTSKPWWTWVPKTIRVRFVAVASKITTSSRRITLQLDQHNPHTHTLVALIGYTQNLLQPRRKKRKP